MVLDVGWHIALLRSGSIHLLPSTRALAHRQRRMLIITFWEHTKNERNLHLCG
jgi:hypothetical protein